MCVPACAHKIATDLSRRAFLKQAAVGAGLAVATAACTTTISPDTELRQSGTIPNANAGTISFRRVVDLTHTLDTDFPTFGGQQQLEIESVFALEEDGYNLNIWHINEHTGTHLDAPFHFSEGATAAQIPVEDLVGPLAVIDIRAKAETDPDAQVTPDDIQAWEAEHGPLPAGAVVAMLSGWADYVATETFRNADDAGGLHFPGFHIEAAELLLTERAVKGIFVDTLSLDHGPSADFAVHYQWLGAGRWGMECVANLAELPASGATVIVGSPKIAGATGGPSRVLALM